MFISTDYDTDEETDELLDKQYTGRLDQSSDYADLSGSTVEEEEVPKVSVHIIHGVVIIVTLVSLSASFSTPVASA